MRLAAFALALAMSLPVVAQSDQAVTYIGGTVPNLKSETEGHLDLSEPASLAFAYPSGKLTIDFPAIESYEYSRQVVHHLGVLPAIAVGLVKARKQSHLLRITYRDVNNTTQIAVFRIPKQMPRTLLPVFEARVPQAARPCAASAYSRCLQK